MPRPSELRPEVLRAVEEICDLYKTGATAKIVMVCLAHRTPAAVMATLRKLTDAGTIVRTGTGGRSSQYRHFIRGSTYSIPTAAGRRAPPEPIAHTPIVAPTLVAPCTLAGLCQQIARE